MLFLSHPASTEIYTLSLHDALPIYLLFCYERSETFIRVIRAKRICVIRDKKTVSESQPMTPRTAAMWAGVVPQQPPTSVRSEEHTSELQSRRDLVCRLLLEKKK